jgi:hypothetical protein
MWEQMLKQVQRRLMQMLSGLGASKQAPRLSRALANWQSEDGTWIDTGDGWKNGGEKKERPSRLVRF